MDYLCIGIDVRNWPCAETNYADSSGCERNEAKYHALSQQFQLRENEFDLLDVHDAVLPSLCESVMSDVATNLVAVEYPIRVFQHYVHQRGLKTTEKAAHLSALSILGYDICDSEGLFTVLTNPKIIEIRGHAGLIEQADTSMALDILQLASHVDRSHAPYVLARIRSLKKSKR